MTSCVEPSRVGGNRGEGKTPETYGGRKFIASNPRKARGLGAPRGRRVGRAPNRRSSTTVACLETMR